MVHMGDELQSDPPTVLAETVGAVTSADCAEVVVDDAGQEATEKLVERITERAELAERMEEASWFQNQPDAFFLAGVLALIPSLWAKVRRAVRRRRPRAPDAHSAQHTR
jgi:hypothetical protein